MYVGLACALSWEVNLGKSLPVVQVLKDEGVVESSWGLATVWQNWSPWREAISEGTASVAVKAPGFGAMRERAMEKVEVWYPEFWRSWAHGITTKSNSSCGTELG